MRLELREILDALSTFLVDGPGEAARWNAVSAEAVVNDSRRSNENAVFVAINGTVADGRLFIRAAAEKGVAAIFAEKPLPPSVSTDFQAPLFFVSDAYAVYARLAEIFAGEPAKRMRLLGVTGTNGKTTTAFLLRSIMERWTGRASGLISTVEYSTTNQRRDAERTTPDASEIQAVLAETLESGSSDAVIEVSSHSLVQNRLGTAKFAAAVFTNLTGDHLDYHKTMDAYFDAKRRLFTRHLAADGTAVLNVDDPCGRILAEELRSAGVETSTFGFSEKADVRVMDLKQSLAGISLTLRVADSADIAVASKLCGAFNAANVAGAAAAALALGATPEAVSDGVAAMTGVPGRMERRPGGNFFVDYAHTDDALENALSMMRSLLDAEGAGGRLILLFGCGGDRDKTKRPRMAMAAAKFADEIFITSDNPRSESPTAIIADILKGMPPSVDCEVVVDRAEAIIRAVEATGPNDALLVAGKGHETYQEVNGRRFPFDDRDMVDSAVACRELRES